MCGQQTSVEDRGWTLNSIFFHSEEKEFFDFCSSVMFVRLLVKLFILFITILDGVYGTLESDGCYSELFESCSNGVSIGYPFWMKDDPSKRGYHCGYPGMSISCPEGRPVINISNHLYYATSIEYNNLGRLRLVDVDIEGSDCPRPRHNISLQSTALQGRYGSGKALIYYNCTKYPPQDDEKYDYHHIPCLDHVDGNVTLRSFLFRSWYYNGGYQIAKRGESDWYKNCQETVEFSFLISPMNSNFTQMLKFGFELMWEGPYSSFMCEDSGGQIVFNETTSAYNCLCYEEGYVVYESVCPHKSGLSIRMKIIVGVCTGAGGLLILILLLSYRRVLFSTCCLERNQSNVEVFLENCGSLATQRYKYSDIKKMTDSFKENLGQGGFGTVFKGKIKDGRLVAVKVLNDSKSNGEDFINEVATISRTNHVNVVDLLGFCNEGTKRALVYEFMPNGSLEKFIYNAKSSSTPSLLLGWEKLYQIALGIAKGLEYLHRGCNTRILHFDIKPHNILLDEDFCPKIADFGLAKLCPTKESVVSMLVARGTIGYIAPEVYCRNFGGVSHKSDVYSYGMMVLEMIGGRKNIDVSVENMSEIYFPQWIYNHFKLDVSVDGCGETFEDQNAKKMITVALWSIQTQPVARPSISKVVEMLEGTTEELEMPPNPFQDPPSSSSP